MTRGLPLRGLCSAQIFKGLNSAPKPSGRIYIIRDLSGFGTPFDSHKNEISNFYLYRFPSLLYHHFC